MGQRTNYLCFLVEWEGNDVLELVEESSPAKPKQVKKKSVTPVQSEPPPLDPSSDEESIGSGDEYVEDDKAGTSGRARKKVRNIHLPPQG